MTTRVRRVFDIEVYPNYTLFMFKELGSARVVCPVCAGDGGADDLGVFGIGCERCKGEGEIDPGLQYFESPFDELDLDAIRYIVRTSTLVTFNGSGYDLPLLLYALIGRSPAQVKHASDRIILQNLRPWNFEREFHVKLDDPLIDHIDLMEVAPLKGSLKLYAARMHSRSIQDLPYPPDQPVNREQQDEIRRYCANDLQSTIDLYNTLKVQIELRESMSATYGVDLRSKSDAQIAEAVIKTEIEKITKKKLVKPSVEVGNTFQYRIPTWMSFEKLDILNDIRSASFVVGDKGSVLMPKELSEKKIRIGNGIYRMGIGGLHSSEACQSKVADSRYAIKDFDVTSYYPSIVINEGLCPKHIGENFLTVYKTIVRQRIEAKKAGKKTIAESLKITANGSFGKLGSRYSVLYSPDLMIQVTVTGQLALLMLIESFWDVLGVEVISANTDGVTVRYERDVEGEVLAAVAAWEKQTGYNTECADYAGLYSRDVNNYIAVKTNGEVKTKGVFGTGLPLQKNPYANICSRAVIDYLTLDASIRGTVEACTDLRQFLCVRTVKGGALFRGKEVGKVVRWYNSTTVNEPLLYKINKHKVPATDCAYPLTEIGDYTCIPKDLDREWYIREAEAMIKEVGLC